MILADVISGWRRRRRGDFDCFGKFCAPIERIFRNVHLQQADHRESIRDCLRLLENIGAMCVFGRFPIPNLYEVLWAVELNDNFQIDEREIER